MASLLVCGSCTGLSGLSCLSNMACSCFGSVTKKSSFLTRLTYTVIFFLTSLFAWIWYKFGEGWYKNIPKYMAIHVNCTESKCFGVMSVYRITAVLCCFFLLHIGFSILSLNNHSLNKKWWGIKILLLIGSIIGSFFLPNQIFSAWSYIAIVGASIFLILQLILLVDFAHSWSESWMTKLGTNGTGDENAIWYYGLIISMSLLYLSSLAMSIAEYELFTHGSGCEINTLFITINIVLIIIGTIASIHPEVQTHNPQSGLIQSGTVAVYSSYLIWSAIMSQPEDILNCNRLTRGNDNFSMIIGTLLIFISVCYSAFRVSMQSENLLPVENETQYIVIQNEGENGNGENERENEIEENKQYKTKKSETYNYFFFHSCFVLASCYIAMLITNWNIAVKQSIGDGEIYVIDKSLGSMWVKIICSWLTHIFYLWSLVAPIIFPNRFF